jgi:hypothetical protein
MDPPDAFSLVDVDKVADSELGLLPFGLIGSEDAVDSLSSENYFAPLSMESNHGSHLGFHQGLRYDDFLGEDPKDELL